MNTIEPLVSAEWLHSTINDPNLIILDASTAANQAGSSSEFENIKIKGARFFDLNEVFSDPNGKFPNTFPGEEQFETGCRNLGINQSSRIVVYDNLGVYTSPRVWWMFKAMGHENVSVLDGGLPEWIRKGFETEIKTKASYPLGDFKAVFQKKAIKDFDFVSANVMNKEQLLIDARSKGRFDGTQAEPRAGLRSGHIPNSLNIPYTSVLEDGKYKTKAELTELFQEINDDSRPLIFSCGSGITACIILLAADLILENEKSVYDGSWTEWASLKKDVDL